MRFGRRRAARLLEPLDSTAPYSDFVAALGQENTPPGGRRTVNRWIDAATVDRESLVLDMACSTGFSGREIHAETGATIHGIDISPVAVSMARERASGNHLLTYQVADAANLPLPSGAFSHVAAGCNFGFIQAREKARAEAARVLKPGGLLCASSFYYRSTPDNLILRKVEAAIGFRPDPGRDYDYWRRFFERDFSLVTEMRSDLHSFDDRQVLRAVHRSLKHSAAFRVATRDEQAVSRQRLVEARLVLNEHRDYQGLAVSVWRRRDQ